MKKFLALFLTFVFVLSAFSSVFAVEESNIALNYSLTYEGEHAKQVPTGTEITVEYAVENVTTDEDFLVYIIQNEIYYDHHFFEFVEDSFDMEISSVTASVKKDEDENNKLIREIYINDRTTQEYKNHQVVGTFRLRVIATSGSSTIKSTETIAYADGNTRYRVHDSLGHLTITVGEPEEETTMYTVTYISDGKTTTEQRAEGEVMQLPSAPSEKPEGKVFDYWEDQTGAKYYPGDEYIVKGDTTFTAIWRDNEDPLTKEYTLTFETNGGSGIEESIKKTNGTVIDLSAYIPTRSGYTFEGWYSDAELTDKVTSVTLDADKTVYAKWAEEEKDEEDDKPTGGGSSAGGIVTKYTISFETDDGTVIEDVEKMRNTSVDLSKYIPEKDGYTFGGWYTDKDLTNKVDEIKVTSDITLYAKWIEGETDDTQKPNYHPDILTDEHYAYIVGREGNMICPEDNITRAEVATIFFRLLDEEIRDESLTKENAFDDVDSEDWYNTAISTLSYIDILKGRTEDGFEPDAYITRAEFTTIAARFSDAVYEGEDLFTDIDGHWAQDYINAAASIGWIVGEDGIFRPDDNITRAEVMTLVNRMLNRQPESREDLLDGMTEWVDNADEGAWYYLAVQEATNSHNYEMKEDKIHEKWVSLTENPDWTELER